MPESGKMQCLPAPQRHSPVLHTQPTAVPTEPQLSLEPVGPCHQVVTPGLGLVTLSSHPIPLVGRGAAPTLSQLPVHWQEGAGPERAPLPVP